MHKIPIIGVLGGIGSGKSTVAQKFAVFGAFVIDADRLAHEVLTRRDIQEKVALTFGPDVRHPDGSIARKVLAEKVFANPEQLNKLNELIHPEVIAQTEILIHACQSNPTCRAIVLDVPLLMEIGWEKRCDFLVFVECSLENRLRRAAQNRKIDAEELKKRENFQISLDKKSKMAHYRINNNSDESEVAEQVAQVFSSIISSK